MVIEIIVMYPIQDRQYRPGIDNLLVLLIGGIPIAMPTVLSVTMAIGSHRLAQQVGSLDAGMDFMLLCGCVLISCEYKVIGCYCRGPLQKE